MTTKAICRECANEAAPHPQAARSRGLCPKHYQRARRDGTLASPVPEDPCPQCTTEGGELRAIVTRGLCRKHYLRARTAGTLGPKYAPRGQGGPCQGAPECPYPVKAKGLCNAHYARQYRGGEAGTAVRQPLGPVCLLSPDCDKPSNGRNGYCSGHTAQLRRGQPLTPLRKWVPRKGYCSASSCDPPKPAANLGLCHTHYARQAAGESDWDRPIKVKAKSGDGHLSVDGYRVVQHEGRKRGEHCVFAEQILGRPLLPTEEVHHRNGNRSDNYTEGPFVMDERGRLRSGNLEVWSTAQPKGQEIGPKMDWAVDMLVTYGQFDMDKLRRVFAVYGDNSERDRYADHQGAVLSEALALPGGV